MTYRCLHVFFSLSLSPHPHQNEQVVIMNSSSWLQPIGAHSTGVHAASRLASYAVWQLGPLSTQKCGKKSNRRSEGVLMEPRGAVALVADWLIPSFPKIVWKRWSLMTVSWQDGGQPRRRVAKTEACRCAMQSVISALANDKVQELVDVFKAAQWWQTITGSHQTIVHITRSHADGGSLESKRGWDVSAGQVGTLDNLTLPLYWEEEEEEKN